MFPARAPKPSQLLSGHERTRNAHPSRMKGSMMYLRLLLEPVCCWGRELMLHMAAEIADGVMQVTTRGSAV